MSDVKVRIQPALKISITIDTLTPESLAMLERISMANPEALLGAVGLVKISGSGEYVDFADQRTMEAAQFAIRGPIHIAQASLKEALSLVQKFNQTVAERGFGEGDE